MTAFKAQAMSQRLQQQLNVSMQGLAFVLSFDSNGYPTLAVTKSAETVWVYIADQGNAGRVDGLGLPQRAYSPHVVQILREDWAGNTAPTQLEMRERITAECVKLGAEVQIWEHEAPTAFVLTGAALIADIFPDPINKLTNGQ